MWQRADMHCNNRAIIPALLYRGDNRSAEPEDRFHMAFSVSSVAYSQFKINSGLRYQSISDAKQTRGIRSQLQRAEMCCEICPR